MKKSILIAITSILLVSCQQSVVFNQTHDIYGEGWHEDSTALFEAMLIDSIGDYQMLINIRHTDKYPYQNLWLFVDITQDSFLLRRDTIEAQMANSRGEWYGAGTSQYTIPLAYINHITLPKGPYIIRVQQGMREEWLRGINAVGVKVEKL